MKIDPRNAAGTTPANRLTGSGSSAGVDRSGASGRESTPAAAAAELSERARLAEAARAALAAGVAAPGRAEKLAALRNAISDGTYRVADEALAAHLAKSGSLGW